MSVFILLFIGCALVSVVGGLLFGLVAWKQWRYWSGFWRRMVLIEGHITELNRSEESLPDGKSWGYQAAYRYHYEGKDYRQVQSIGWLQYRNWQKGKLVTVRVDPENAEHADMKATANLLGDTSIIWSFTLAGLLCFGCAGLFVWLILEAVWTHAQLP